MSSSAYKKIRSNREEGAHMAERLERPDLGPRYTPEDQKMLRWLGEQGGAQFVQMQRLGARCSAAPERLVNPALLSIQRMRKKKDKWLKAGFIAYKTYLANEKGWLWLTRLGMEFVGLGDVRYYEPRLESLHHLYYVNQARLYIEQQRPEDIWKSERLLRFEQPAFSVGKKAPHIPDALLQKPNGETIAIEVELTLKKRERILAIVKELTHAYHRIWYFVARPAWATVEAALAQLPENQRKRVQMLSVEEKLH